MATLEFGYASGQTLRYLDAGPMICALRLQPGDFEFSEGALYHVPSRHRFHFDRRGKVSIEARCGCAVMEVRPEQDEELFATFQTWRREYWTPIETHREFASHFEEAGAFLRLLRDIRMAFRRYRHRAAPERLPIDGFIPAAPAE